MTAPDHPVPAWPASADSELRATTANDGAWPCSSILRKDQHVALHANGAVDLRRENIGLLVGRIPAISHAQGLVLPAALVGDTKGKTAILELHLVGQAEFQHILIERSAVTIETAVDGARTQSQALKAEHALEVIQHIPTALRLGADRHTHATVFRRCSARIGAAALAGRPGAGVVADRLAPQHAAILVDTEFTGKINPTLAVHAAQGVIIQCLHFGKGRHGHQYTAQHPDFRDHGWSPSGS